MRSRLAARRWRSGRGRRDPSSSNIDHYDFDLGGPLLHDGRRRIADCGDLMLSETDGETTARRSARRREILLKRGAVPS